MLIAFLAGMLLGAVFFGGLWWTVRKSLASPRAALWVFTSLLLRMGIVMLGFYFVGAHDWRRLLACLIGFVVARFIVIHLTRVPVRISGGHAQEASHAP
jgi:F1F0 ATPase subunit 2